MPPEQKVVGPLGVIVGVVGESDVTVVVVEVAEQPLESVAVTLYEPAPAVIDCVVAPFDHA